MGSSLVWALVLLGTACWGVRAAQRPLLPNHFRMDFTCGDVNNTRRIRGTLYYRASPNAMAMHHDAGAYECAHFYNVTNEPCINVFDHRGTWAVLPEQRRCWLDVPGVGPLPQDWLAGVPAVGTVNVPGCGNTTRYNTHPPVYYALPGTNAPCCVQFVPKFGASGSQLDFLPASLHLGPVASKMFELPDYCNQ